MEGTTPLGELAYRQRAFIAGRVHTVLLQPGSGVPTLECTLVDDTGAIKAVFLGRWIKHGGFYPDPKLRLIRHGAGNFEEYGAHPTIRVQGPTARLKHALIHDAYPTLRGYIDHMNSYSSMGATVAVEKGHRRFSLSNIVARPLLTFFYNYFIRLGLLDGREGLLLHLYHAVYVSWKYSKAWELARNMPKDG